MKQKYIKYALTFLLFAGSFVFWGFLHPELLFFHEFYQMFLFGADYFLERIGIMGGLSDYVAEFLTQFYYYPLLGAAVIAALNVVFQIVTYRTFKIFGVNEGLWQMSFLPVFFMWAFMCNENLLLNFYIAVLMAVSLFLLTDQIKIKAVKAALIAIFYWLIGPAVITTAFAEALRNYKTDRGYALWIVPMVVFEMFLCSQLVCYQTEFFYVGVDYIRYAFMSYGHLMMFAICPLLPFALGFWEKDVSVKTSNILTAAIAVAAILVLPKCPGKVVTETIRMYSHVHKCEWDEALDFYDKHFTKNPCAMQCHNLALAERGLLTEKMFHYPQPGIAALTVDFKSDMFSSLACAEVFYNIGAYNLAQRYFYECQSNVGNFRNSSKIFMRLAKVAIYNKDFKVARKYLLALSKTMFYKDEAVRYFNLIADEDNVTNMPEFAQGFSIKLDIDGAWEELHADIIFENLLKKNPSNYAALQYYQAYCMLTMDLDRLSQSLGLLAALGKKELPRHVQEALVMYYYNVHKSLDNLPKVISQDVVWAFKSKVLDNTFWMYTVNMNKQNNE